MSQVITLNVRDKIASCITEKPVVCGNSDYEIHFDFDEEWNGHEVKTAVFTVNGKSALKPFSGTVCKIPELNNTLILWVGVFAGTIDDGTLSTSTPALIKCVPCATDGEHLPFPPPDDVYNQIVELCDEAVSTANDVKERADNGEFNGKDGADGKDGKDGADGKTAYQYAVDGGYEGSEEDFARDTASITIAKESAEQAASNASASEQNASTSEQNANASAESARESADKAKEAADNAENAVMEYIEKSPTRNLLNVTWENADFNQGVFNSVTTGDRTAFADYIPVVGGENYTLSWIKNNKEAHIYLFEYDKDENYIKYIYLTSTNSESLFTQQLDATCAFIRIKLWESGQKVWQDLIPENFQFEHGAKATSYVNPMGIDLSEIDDVALGDRMGEHGVIPKVDNYIDRIPLTETLSDKEAWETSGINANGKEVNSTHRLRTIDYIQMRKGDSIYLYNGDVFEYDLITKEFISSAYTSGWKTEYIVQNDCFVRIVLYWDNKPETIETHINRVKITRNNRERVQFPALPIDKLRDFSQNVADERIVNARLVTNSKYTGSQNPLFKQIAHRGFRGTGAPQCTAPAYIEAKKFGYSGGENDLQITTDGIFVMAHDVTLPSDKSITVNQSTYATLIDGNMGTFNGKEVKIMTFEEWLVLMKKIGLEPYVDLKSGLDVDQAKDVIAIVRKHGLLDKVTWSGSKGSAVNLRAAYPKARIALLYSDELSNFDSLEDLIIEGHPELTVLYMKSTLVDEAFMTEAISRGFCVECWHCDYSANGFTTEEAILGEVERVLNLGVTGICLDTYLPCEYFIDKFNSEWGLK